MSFQMFITLMMLGFGGTVIARVFRRRRIEQRLRDNPAQKVWCEIKLPGEVSDSMASMSRLYRKLGTVVMTDSKVRRDGGGVVSVMFLAEVPKGRSSPEIRCLVGCPPEHQDLVKRGISQVYQGLAEIVTLKEPPLDEVVQQWNAQFKPERNTQPTTEGMPQ